jgi:hypothetical protein
MNFHIQFRYGGGPTGNDLTAVQAHTPREVRPGFWNRVLRFLSPTRCVASLNRHGFWCEEGWEHTEAPLRFEAENHPDY